VLERDFERDLDRDLDRDLAWLLSRLLTVNFSNNKAKLPSIYSCNSLSDKLSVSSLSVK
jgi:hypothetical protein